MEIKLKSIRIQNFKGIQGSIYRIWRKDTYFRSERNWKDNGI